MFLFILYENQGHNIHVIFCSHLTPLSHSQGLEPLQCKHNYTDSKLPHLLTAQYFKKQAIAVHSFYLLVFIDRQCIKATQVTPTCGWSACAASQERTTGNHSRE